LKAKAKRTVLLALSVTALVALVALIDAQQPAPDSDGASPVAAAVTLAPTNHPVLPRDLSRLWYAPERGTRFAVERLPLGEYPTYDAGLKALQDGRFAEARELFQRVQAARPIGYLAEAAALGEAECAEGLKDYDRAIEIYERLAESKTLAPEEVLMRLGGAAKAAGELKKAGEAFGRVVYDFPLTAVAPLAATEYSALPNVQRLLQGSQRYKLELGRAERLFGARRYADARSAFDALRPLALGDDRELIDLRLAESDYFLKRARSARDSLKRYIDDASRKGEALYFYAVAVREAGDRDGYLKTIRRVADEFPTESWAEEALNNLASHHIVNDQDDLADAVFRELYGKYSKGSYAERAAWKIGWRAYRSSNYAETVRYFEQAAADFPRSDYRPSWLYWSGRAHEQLKHAALARERYMLTAADYLNSYYGRLAVRRLNGLRPPERVFGEPTSVLPPPPNEGIVRALLAAARYDDALNELRFAQRAWGDSPALQATIAWTYYHKGRSLPSSVGATDRFNLLRGSITFMRRAYPQFLAAGGADLPREILTMIYPLAYWDLIRKYSAQNDLDPYLVAALVAQESTFVPDIRSHANAVGLMQLMSFTARQYARKLKIPYSSRVMTNPESSIRIGTMYFADKVKEFGGVHLALASYNAGESAVRRWLAERPGLTDREEFIDDIPYPETQNYVKRILGTAEDYRRLYGP
jgi:peptidoglycan lytic transglycosylase